jgi:serine/threonine protein phosphatase PrpC
LQDKVCEQTEFDTKISGSTLTIVLIEDDMLYCANVGDSKALLILDSKINALTLKRGLDHPSMLSKTQVLTTTHTPD